MKTIVRLLLAGTGILLLTACGGTPAPTATPTALPPTEIQPTATSLPPTPTQAAVPTETSSVEGAQISDLKAEADGDSLVISFAFTGPLANYNAFQVFIDTDRSAATGYSINGIGADRLLEGPKAYTYKGDGKSWDWDELTVPVEYMPTEGLVTWKIGKEPLGLAQAAGADFVAQLVDTNWDAAASTPKTSFEFK